MRGDPHEPFLARSGDGGGGQRPGGTQPIQRLVVRQGHHGGPQAGDLFGETPDVAPGREADDLQSLGMRSHHRERAPADGAGRAENGDPLHGRRPPANVTTV